MLVCASAAPALAQYETIHDFSKISSETSIFLMLAQNDRFGASMAGVSDFGFDGFDDIAVGAPGDSSVEAGAGAIWLVGLQDDATINLAFRLQLDATNLQVGGGLGSSIDVFDGLSGAGPGGPDDIALVTGVPGFDGSLTDQGAITIILVNRFTFATTETVITFGVPGFMTNPSMNENFGASVAVIGDQDGNGFADLAVGAPGIDTGGVDAGGVYILLLGSGGTVVGFERIDASNGLAAPLAAGDLNGSSVAGIGDANGDGNRDIAVGAPGDNNLDDDNAADSGSVRLLLLGSDGSVLASRKITPTSSDFVAAGGTLAAGDGFGAALDFGNLAPAERNLIVGASGDSGNRGAIWILTLDGTNVVGAERVGFGTADFAADLDPAESFGASVAALSDLDQDGLREIVVGHPFDDDGMGAGAAWILSFGPCGNGVLEAAQDEQCDDGAREAGDCCSPGCKFDDVTAACTDDFNVCTDDHCDGAGTCLHEGNSNPCEDETTCNGTDTCDPATGTCMHSADLCVGGAECQTFCNVDTKSCANVVGDPCTDDGNPCTADVCDGMGNCSHPPNFAPCTDDGNPCTNDICNDAAVCDHVGNFEPCNDGNPCTLNEQCDGAGVCDPDDSITDGMACEDGDACTTGTTCMFAACGGGMAVDCSGMANDCNTASCDSMVGCLLTPVMDTTPCNDGSPCTLGDQCTGGVCAGTVKDCSGFSTICADGVCNDATGNCEAHPIGEGENCDDSLACTTGDKCVSGVCTGTPADCSSFGDQCNNGVCNAGTGMCEAVAVENGTGCDDGSLCTTGDVCTGGTCAGTPIDCSAQSDACNNGACNPATGGCEAVAVENGTGCDDGSLCTIGDVCTGGVCAGTPLDCSASGDQCNDGVCNPVTGQCEPLPKPNDTGCNDGLLCTVPDVCTDGVCGGAPMDCSVFNDQCNVGVCNPGNGMCIAMATNDGLSCSDGDPCTDGDICGAGVCTGAPVDCSFAGDACNTGVCNPVDGSCGQQSLPDNEPCDDGLFCTALESCQSGQCVGENPCGLFTLCNDSCNEATDECRSCGRPYSAERCVVNAVFILQGAVGLQDCKVCWCDVNFSFDVTATDAIAVLRTCVDLPQQLSCPTGNVLQGPEDERAALQPDAN
ncbi:MAG TPA: integrin alpha [Candidatus Limnocylindrales bacterium]|nr:integrin alpha [Candidatus Limnocylindrales bacterium]